MGVDELKLIIQALAGLADGAKEGFIWWLVIEGAMPKLLLALFGAGVLGVGVYVAKLVYRHASSTESSETAVRQIARLVGKEIYGSWIPRGEAAGIVDAVAKALRQKDGVK
ncbi:hypothetical protein KTD13_16660 [Burkholderia multivorans]|uniref:hypothetical protein n=1 Tax=Burkholderia multivorans TaxID=87883 RepID=UPI001C22CE94|nr:hypothetical protein [Burkholderia multivorans]MBU9261989.1 hypothetical protein [Burkholderia multivorans]